MNCQTAQNSLSAYLDRELSGDQMMALRSHVEYCSECQSELESLRTLKSALCGLAKLKPREKLANDIIKQIKAQEQPVVKVPIVTMLATSVAAAMLALTMFNMFFGNKAVAPVKQDVAKFDVTSDSAVTSPDFGSHAPLISVSR